MTVQLDHFIVPSRNAKASAQQLGELLGVPWGVAKVGPFVAVYLNEGLTLDFQDTDQAFPVSHYCFRIGQHEFDAILARIKAAGIDYRSTVHGPWDFKASEEYGNVYWNVPDGHQWEILTSSYARRD